MEWKPIESAPKDEDIPILCWDGKDMVICDWLDGFDEWNVTHDIEGLAWNSYRPTHWATLPDPPSKPLANSNHTRGNYAR